MEQGEATKKENFNLKNSFFLFLLKNYLWIGQCSQTCGGGFQTRKAHCVDLSGRMIPDQHCAMEEKIVRQACHIENCPRWEVGEWTPVKIFPLSFSYLFVIRCVCELIGLSENLLFRFLCRDCSCRWMATSFNPEVEKNKLCYFFKVVISYLYWIRSWSNDVMIEFEKKTILHPKNIPKPCRFNADIVFGELRDGRAPTWILVSTRKSRHRQKLLLSGPASCP